MKLGFLVHSLRLCTSLKILVLVCFCRLVIEIEGRNSSFKKLEFSSTYTPIFARKLEKTRKSLIFLDKNQENVHFLGYRSEIRKFPTLCIKNFRKIFFENFEKYPKKGTFLPTLCTILDPRRKTLCTSLSFFRIIQCFSTRVEDPAPFKSVKRQIMCIMICFSITSLKFLKF